MTPKSVSFFVHLILFYQPPTAYGVFPIDYDIVL